MKKALIVYGGWPGHEPEKCTEIIKGMLEPEGYEVRAEYQTLHLQKTMFTKWICLFL